MNTSPATTSGGHLNGTGWLIAWSIMAGGLILLCLAIVAASYGLDRRQRRATQGGRKP